MADKIFLPAIPNQNTFGGPFENAIEGIADPSTDMEAYTINSLNSHALASSYVLPRCIVKIRSNAFSDYRSVWGNADAYKPDVVHVGTGHYTVTFSSSYNDLQATPEAQDFSIWKATADVYSTASSGPDHSPPCVSYTSTVVTIYTYDELQVAGNMDFDLIVYLWLD